MPAAPVQAAPKKPSGGSAAASASGKRAPPARQPQPGSASASIGGGQPKHSGAKGLATASGSASGKLKPGKAPANALAKAAAKTSAPAKALAKAPASAAAPRVASKTAPNVRADRTAGGDAAGETQLFFEGTDVLAALRTNSRDCEDVLLSDFDASPLIVGPEQFADICAAMSQSEHVINFLAQHSLCTDRGISSFVERCLRAPVRRCSFERLSFTNCALSDAGVSELAAGLCDSACDSLIFLDLDMNRNVTDSGALALVRCIEELKFIEHIGLMGTSVARQGDEALAQAWKKRMIYGAKKRPAQS